MRVEPTDSEQNLLLQTVMQTILDGLIVIDGAGTIKSINAAATRLFGYEAEEVVGKNVKLLMPEPYHSAHDGYLRNYLDTGEKKVIGIGREVSARRKDGSVFPMELGINEMSFEGRRMFVGTIRDITDRKNDEQMIRDYLEQLQTVMQTILDGLIVIDGAGTIKSINTAATRLFGYEAEEVVGKNVKLLMPEPYHSAHDGYLRNYLDTGEKKVIGIGREVSARRKDGSVFPMELGINEMSFEGQRMFVGTIRDITDRKDAEQRIHDYLGQLERSNKELDDFAYIASHDLKEPLRGLANNALFIREDYQDKLDEDGRKRLNRMGYLCQRMEQLVDDLLYFSRLGRQELAIQRVDLNTVIHDISTMMVETLHEQNAKISIAGALPTITCDMPRITEVFRNLITNAIKYNKSPEKQVEVGVVKIVPPGLAGEKQDAFYVKDNGIGIGKEFYSDVFRIFKRLNAEDDSVKGTGVGLTFVKKIVERHNGVIWIDSKVGEGTTFYFTLNLSSGAATNE